MSGPDDLTTLGPDDPEDGADLADRLCDDLHRRWRDGQRVRAESYFARHPDLPDDARFELIYNEYLVRESSGEPPPAGELIARFPEFADRLRRQLSLHQALRGEEATGPDVRPEGSEPAAGAPGAIPGYDVLDVLGRGGMGVVYRARQQGLGRAVALKIIRPTLFAEPGIAARFRAEAEAAARLQHPNIIGVFQVGEHAGQGFLAMEYAPGGSLQQRLAAGPLPPREAAALVEALARAVDFAHGRGIVHRDLKPANVVLAEGGVPKLTDFGLAKLVEADLGLTRTGDLLGTPSYMAPEQARGEARAVGPGTDIYALGAVLYAALTARPPFQGETPLSTLDQVTRHEPLPPGRLQRHTPRDLETICLKALEKAPAHRYPTAGALADDVRRFLDGRPIRARRVSWAGQAWKWCRREPAKAALAASLATAVAAGLVATTALWRRAERKAADAVEGRQLAGAAHAEALDSLYVSQIARARLEWRAGAVDRVDALLDRAEPTRQGWEWAYLRRLNHPELFAAHDGDWPDVTGVAFSPDGRRLAALRIDPFRNPNGDPALAVGSVGIYDAGDGRLLARFDAPRAACRLSWSPDGDRLVVGGAFEPGKAPGAAVVWDARSRRVVASWDAGGTVAFAPNGGAFVVGRGDSAALLGVGDRAEIGRFASTGGRAVVGPRGKRLAISGPSAVVVRSVATGELVAELPHGPAAGPLGHRADYYPGEGPDLAFSPDERRIVVATEPPRLWEIGSARPLHSLAGHDGPVLAVAFSPDGRTVATAGRDATIRLWDARTGAARAVLRGHAERAACLAFHPDGHALASGGRRDGDVKVWDLTRHPEYHAIAGVRAQAIGFEPGGRLRIARKFGLLERWEPTSGREERGPFADITERFVSPAALAAFDANARRLATVTRGRSVAVLDLESGRERVLAGLSAPASFVAISPDGRRVAAIGLDTPERQPGRKEFRVWEADSGATVAAWSAGRFPERRNHGAIAFRPDGREVAFDDYEPAGGQGTPQRTRAVVVVRPVASGADRLRLPLAENRVIAIAFSPDGATLAAADNDGVVGVWSARDGRRRHVFRPKEPFPVYDLGFSPDGRRLAGADREKAMVWDLASGEEVITLRIDGRRPSDGGFNPRVAWSPDGHRLAASTWDDGVAVWAGDGPPPTVAGRFVEAQARRFAWHLAECAAALDADDAEAVAFHLARLRAEPTDAPARLRRAALHLRLGDWPAAAADYRRWAESGEPDEGPGWLGLARALLMTGDAAGYRALCARLTDPGRPEARQPSTWALARALALAPGGADPAEARRRIANAVPAGKQAARVAFTAALAAYRAGVLDEALDRAGAAGTGPGGTLAVRPLLALIHHAAGRDEEARTWLAKADALGERPAQAADGRPDLLPDDWPEFHLLRAEARARLAPRP